jgi:hypothetical protein
MMDKSPHIILRAGEFARLPAKFASLGPRGPHHTRDDELGPTSMLTMA